LFDKGAVIARLLSGSWRENPQPTDITADELNKTLPIILSAGTEGLAYKRVSVSDYLKISDAASSLRESASDIALRSAMQAVAINSVEGILSEAGIEALYFKGAAAAHYYARSECRPVGDIDFLVHPEQEADAKSMIEKHYISSESAASETDKKQKLPRWYFPPGVSNIDLHSDLAKFRLGSTAEVFQRSIAIEIENTTVSIPCEEDHLKLLCLHFLRHGGWRPSWLCDVATLIEARNTNFGWDACLGSDPVTRNWISIVVLLAHHLLGAKLDGVPEAITATVLPRWVPMQVNLAWGLPMSTHLPGSPFRHTLRNRPHHIFREMLARCPNPIGATMRVGAPFNSGQQWPNQLRLAGSRASSIVWGRG